MIPTDEDLDGLLKAWMAPRSSDSLETRVRRAYGNRIRPRTKTPWIARLLPIAGKFVGATAAALVLLAVITRAFPQSLNLVVHPGAIVLDSEALEYKDDGSYTVTEYRISSFHPPTVDGEFLDGGETILSSYFPGDPLKTFAHNLLDPMIAIAGTYAHRLFDPLFYKPHRAEHLKAIQERVSEDVRNGCTPNPPTTVIGKETILNYPTTVVRTEREKDRSTAWAAPELACWPLRTTVEKPHADGTFHLVFERRVVKVTR
jgi:hypothetical protein